MAPGTMWADILSLTKALFLLRIYKNIGNDQWKNYLWEQVKSDAATE